MADRVKELVEELGAVGANIIVRPCNVVNKSEVNDLINVGLAGLPPIRGVVHGTMVLRVCASLYRSCPLDSPIRDIYLVALLTKRHSTGRAV